LLAQIPSIALHGVDAVPVHVEVSVERGLPCFLVVGLPDAAVRESRDRVQAAFRQVCLEFPAARVTVNLAPADLRKEGTWFDLPIALGLLAASRQIPGERFSEWLVMGELSLDGSVRPVRGVLAAALAAASGRRRGVIVPRGNALEALAVGEIEVVGVESLGQAMDWGRGRPAPAPPARSHTPLEDGTDPLAAIVGQPLAKRALAVAAAGGHGILFVGPPGTGKSLLSRAVSALLPPLTRQESLTVSRIHSVAGLLRSGAGLVERPPFRAPHVSASAAGVLGGGSPLRPGEVTLAHLGVLFLDELPEFSRAVLEGLRQPLEDGEVTLVRAHGSVRLPARVQLVAAMNPCPCGFLGHPRRACRCPAAAVARYRSRVSGPLLERIDLAIEVPVESSDVQRLWRASAAGEESAASVRARVTAAREFARRLGRTTPNARLASEALRETVRLEPAAEGLLTQAVSHWSLSARAVHRTLRVARTIADLEQSETIRADALAEALSSRHESLRLGGAA
jgi:magnesium chelatase family protein